MAITVFAYFNVDQVAGVMDAMAAITSSSTFKDAFRTIALLSFVVWVAGVAVGKSQNPLEFFRWLLVIVLINSALLLPKTDVVIIDRTGSTPPTVRSNIPVGFAYFASLSSTVGDYLTRTFETVFALSDDLQFQKNGMMFGNTVFTRTLRATPTQVAFRTDLTNFINSCTYFDILASRVNPNLVSSTGDIWAELSNTSYALSTPISTDPSGSKICKDAYDNITSRFPAAIQNYMEVEGRQLNPNAVSNTIAAAALDSQIGNSYAKLAAISKSSTDILRQNMVANSLVESQTISSQRLDQTSKSIVESAQTQIESTANLQGITMARVAERAAPAIRNAVEIILYAVFPIVVLLLLISAQHAATVLKGYLTTMLWVQIIPPLFAVLNYVMVTASATKIVGVKASTSPDSVNLLNIGQLAQTGISDLAIAGFLTLAIPLIAWSLIKAGEIGGAALFTAAMSGASSSAGSTSGSLASGNISQGGVSLDTSSVNTASANRFDLAPSMASGFTRMTNAAGTQTFGADGTYRFQANQSSIPVSANFGGKLSNAITQEASLRGEVSQRESQLAAESKTAALVERMGLVRATASSKGTNNLADVTQGSRSAQTAAQLETLAEVVNKRLGLASTSHIGRDVVGAISLGAKGSAGAAVPGQILKAEASFFASASTTTNTKAGQQQNFDAAVAFARDQVKSQNLATDLGIHDDWKSSEAFMWGTANRTESVKAHDASLSKATTHAKNSESAKSESFALGNQAAVVRDTWSHMSTDVMGYVANRMASEHKLGAFNMLYQTDPQAAARMAAPYVMEVMPSLQPTTLPTDSLTTLQSQSPQLDGKTLESESARLQPSPNNVEKQHAQNKVEILKQGYSQKDVQSNLPAVVSSKRSETQGDLDARSTLATEQYNAARTAAGQTLDRQNLPYGLSGPPEKDTKPGTAFGNQTATHKDLFPKADQPKPP